MSVNKIPFLITVGRNIGLLMMEPTKNRMANQLGENLMNVVKPYTRAGYEVETLFMDMEFDKLKAILTNWNINTSAAREHVAELERWIRVIEERCRGIMSKLHSSKCPTYSQCTCYSL